MSEVQEQQVGEPVGGEASAQATLPAGSPPGEWNAGMTVEQREHPSLRDFSSMEALAGSFINTKAMVGQDKIVMPQSEEDWSNVYSKLGRPDTAGEYEFSGAPDLGADLNEVVEQDRDWFAEVAHQAGLSQNQANNLFNAYANEIGEMEAGMSDQNAADQDALLEGLSKEWGHNYDTNLAVADRAVRHIGGDGLMDALVESGAAGQPEVMKAFLKIGEMMREDIGVDRNGGDLYTTDQLRDQISTLQTNPAYKDATNPDHNRIVQQMLRLNERIYGTGLA